MDSMSGMMGLPERGYDGRGRFRLLAQGLVPPTLGAELLCGADVLGIAACGLGSLAVSGGGALVPEHALLAGGEVLGGAVLGGLLLRWMRPAAADPVRALASAALGGLVLMALLGVVGLLDGAVHGMGGGHVVLWSAPPMTDWVACWAVLATGLVVLGRTGAVLWSAVLPRPELADASPIPPAGALAKAFTDRLLAGTALLLLSPLLLAVAIAVRLDSPGPAIFRQEREGLHGRRFTVLKFRSMRVAAAGEALRQTERGDARCSALGAFLRRSSLDELPQLHQRAARRHVPGGPPPARPGDAHGGPPLPRARGRLRPAPPGAAGAHRLGAGERGARRHQHRRRAAPSGGARPPLRGQLVLLPGPADHGADRGAAAARRGGVLMLSQLPRALRPGLAGHVSHPAVPSAPVAPSPARAEFVRLHYAIEALRQGDAPVALQFLAASPGEGTSTVALGFAQAAAAERPHAVLLVDCSGVRDGAVPAAPAPGLPAGERPPSLVAAFREGLPLRAACWPDRSGAYGAGHEGLWRARLGGGPNPLLSLGGPELRRLLTALGELFATVALDCPAAAASPDGAALSRHCDGTVLVVRARTARARAVRRTAHDVERAGGQLVGCVLNRRREALPGWLGRRL